MYPFMICPNYFTTGMSILGSPKLISLFLKIHSVYCFVRIDLFIVQAMLYLYFNLFCFVARDLIWPSVVNQFDMSTLQHQILII